MVYDDGVNISEDTDPGREDENAGKTLHDRRGVLQCIIIHVKRIQYRSYRFSIGTMAIFWSVSVVSICVQSTPRQGKEVGELTEGIAKLAKRRLDCTWLTSRDVAVVLR